MSSETVVSKELFPETLLTNRGVASRQDIRIQPRDGAASYTVTTGSQPVIRFQLPNSYYMNLSQIQFKFAMAITGGTTPSLNNGIWSLFSRVRVLAASTVLVDEQAYNLLQNVKYYLNAAAGGTIAPWMGVDSQANRRTYASAGRDYMFQPLIGIAEDKLFPLPRCQDIFIEFYPANPNTCVESATAITAVTITTPVLIATGVTPSVEYDNAMADLIARGECQYLWKGSNYYINPCTSTSNQIRVNETSKSVEKIYCVQRLGANIADITVSAKLDTWNFNTTAQLQFKVNNVLMPAEPMQIGANAIEAFMYVLRTNYDHEDYDKYGDLFKDLDSLTYATYVSGKFVLGYQFDKSKAAGNVLSGLDTSNVGSGILIQLQEAATADNNLEVFPIRDVQVVVRQNGMIEMYQ